MAPSDEWALVRRRVGLLDRRDFGVLEVTGRDRATFLHALLSNEIKALAPGQGSAATLLDVHGKVQVVLFVWVLDDRILLVVPPGTARKVLAALDHYLFSEKVSLRDASEETALFLLVGPEAPALVERLTGVRPPAPAWSNVGATLDGIAVRLVTGGGETGGLEAWVACGATHGPRVWDALVGDAAPPHGAEVVVDGTAVGRVTSATRSLGLGRPIALALVRREHAEPGRAVAVRLGAGTVSARVAALPFAR